MTGYRGLFSSRLSPYGLSALVWLCSAALKLSRPYKRQADGTVLFCDDEVSLRSQSRPLMLSLTHERGLSRLGLKVEKHAGQTAQFGFAWERKF
jgi:hypothetical protein